MESIIIFIIFAVISSLFKKDKKPKRTYGRPKGLENKETDHGVDNTFDKPMPQRQISRGSLGDLFKEFKTDFDDVFKDKTPSEEKREEASTPVAYEYEGYEYANQYQQHVDQTPKKTQVSKNPTYGRDVYDGEIGDAVSEINLSFDEEALLQGIIMSEILGKPKALRK